MPILRLARLARFRPEGLARFWPEGLGEILRTLALGLEGILRTLALGLAGIFRTLALAPRALALGLIGAWRLLISPLFPGRCRFWPSCSDYAGVAFRRLPFFRALRLTALRLLKCNPWHPGGVDPPPES